MSFGAINERFTDEHFGRAMKLLYITVSLSVTALYGYMANLLFSAEAADLTAEVVRLALVGNALGIAMLSFLVFGWQVMVVVEL